jgi:hypothetical protein
MDAESTVRVPLTLEERAERADEMARLIARIEGVEDEAKERAAEYREEIKGLEAELRSLAASVREGAEERRQMDLTFPQEEAAKALHDVGAAACTCEGGPEAEVKDPACPVHGVETRGENPAVDDKGPIPVEPGAEASADYVVPEGAAVDVGKVGEPVAVADFHAAKAKRRKRA